MPKARPEWVQVIQKAINAAYEAGEIQTLEDFKKVFLIAWDSLGVNKNHLRGAALASVMCASNPVIVAIRQKAAEVNRPITNDSNIEALPLSRATVLRLRRCGYFSIEDIVNYIATNQYGLISIRGIGEKCAEEIYGALKWAGIEIPLSPESSGQDDSEGFTEEPDEDEAERSDITINLEGGGIFRTEFSPDSTGEVMVVILFSKLKKSLTIRARRIAVEAEG